jgi:VWFA-related protein
MRQPSVLIPIIFLALAALPALAEERPAGAFSENIEVRVVNLEVVVTDRGGRRVPGLGPGDFQLRVDGRELPIEYFTEIAGGHRAEADADAGAAGARSAPAIGAVAPGQAVGTGYLVFIDDYFTELAARRNQVLDEIAGQLGRLGPADRVAVVAFNGRKVEMLSPWKRPSAELSEVFELAKSRPAHGRRLGAEVGFSDQIQRVDIAETSSSDPVSSGDQTISAADREEQARATIDFLERQLERVALGVTATLRGFAAPPGRKVMLLLSGGWPHSVYEYVLGATPLTERSGASVQRGPEIFRQIYDTANLLGYTLYPIDLPGRSGSLADASEADDVAMPRTGPGLSGASGDPTIPFSFVREDEIHTTLHRLAVETGGVSMIDAARLRSLAAVIDDTRSYYWLGFTPDWQGDDRTHKVRLEVLRPGLEVRHRAGFKDLSRSAELDFMVESALLFGSLPGTRPLGLEAGPLPAGKRRVELPLTLRIPMDEITMLPVGTEYVAELELRVGAIDEDGRRNEISVVPVSLRGPDPPPAGSYATYEFAVRIRHQPQDLVVTLHDPVSDRILAAVTRVEG